MPREEYIFPPAQAEFLRALRNGSYRGAAHPSALPTRVSLESGMPPVHEQAMRGTCVAAAAAAMLEYKDDCKTRLSVQFLDAATRKIESDGLEECLAAVREGRQGPAAFETVFAKQLKQLRMLADMNGGMSSPAMRKYLSLFESAARSGLAAAEGSLLAACFRAAADYGVCRHSLWPYAAARSGAVRFGGADFPPGAMEDARKRRAGDALYMLPAPNNVEEIKGILAGANGRRPMPVCITVDYFDGCHDGGFSFPCARERADGALASANAHKGVHCVLAVGYALDAAEPGGGHFIVRNSWGAGWGRGGYGKMPFAYLECFAHEAGTVLQEMLDYAGDGYGGMRPRPRSRAKRIAVQLALAALLAGAAAGTALLLAGGEEGGAAPRAPAAPAAINPIADDGAAPEKCTVLVYGADRGEAVALVVRLLPDVKPEMESDDWNDTLVLRISRTRFKKLAGELQLRLRRNVFLSGRGRTLEIAGRGAAQEVEIQTDMPLAVIRWLREKQQGRAKIIEEREFGLSLLVFGRDDFMRELKQEFAGARIEGDTAVVRRRRRAQAQTAGPADGKESK